VVGTVRLEATEKKKKLVITRGGRRPSVHTRPEAGIWISSWGEGLLSKKPEKEQELAKESKSSSLILEKE